MQRLHPKYKVDVLRAWAETEASSWGHVGGWQDSGAVAARLPGTLLRGVGWIGDPGSLSSHLLLDSVSPQHPCLFPPPCCFLDSV